MKALVNYCAKEFESRSSKNPRKVKPTAKVSLAKDILPISVRRHIKSCFTKKGLNLDKEDKIDDEPSVMNVVSNKQSFSQNIKTNTSVKVVLKSKDGSEELLKSLSLIHI